MYADSRFLANLIERIESVDDWREYRNDYGIVNLIERIESAP